MIVLVILEGVVVAILLVLVVGLLRSHAEILRRLHELGAGVYDDAAAGNGDLRASAGGANGSVNLRTRPGVPTPRPGATAAVDLVGTTPRGAARSVSVVGAPHATLLAFLSSGCTTCAGFWEAFREGAGDELPGEGTRLVVLTRGAEAESPAVVQGLAPKGSPTLMSTGAFEAYEVPMSPYFILVDGPSGKVVGEGAATTWPQVRELLAQALADSGPGGGDREARVDAELHRAGIAPGHHSLYPSGAGTGPAPEPGDVGSEWSEPPGRLPGGSGR